jgi:hypothetical protein
MPVVRQHDRLLGVGLCGVALGLALMVSGASAASRDWFIVVAGIAVAALALSIVANALLAKRRTVTSPPNIASRTTPRALFGSYLRRARRSRRSGVLAILSVVWIAYNAVAFVASLAEGRWASAIVYGVLTAIIPLLALLRLPTTERNSRTP